MNWVQRVALRALGAPPTGLARIEQVHSQRELVLEALQAAGFLQESRAHNPLGEMIKKHLVDQRGIQNIWAPEVYGEFYATSVPVFRAVKLRSDAVASAPMKVFQETQGELEWVGNRHPVQELLDRVNGWQTHADMWRAVETYLNLWGSAFRFINKRGSENPALWEIWQLRPDKVVVIKDRKRFIKGFIFDPGGTNFPMLPEEVIWDRYFNPLDEFAGLSPIAAGRLSLEMQRDMLKVNRQLFKNGVLVQNLAFLMNAPLTDTDVDEFYRRLERRHQGGSQYQRPIVMSKSDGEVRNLGFSNREMEFFNGLTFTLQEAARVFSVPPPMMYDMSQTIFNNVSEARHDFYENTITQEWTLLEVQMQERFIPMLPLEHRNLLLRFDKSGIPALQESENEKALRDQSDVVAGIKTINEVRRDRGLPEVPWGDDWWIPFGQVPASQLVSGEISPVPAEPVVPASMDRLRGETRLKKGVWAGWTRQPLPHEHFSRKMLASAKADQEELDRTCWDAFVRRLEEEVESFDEAQGDLFEEQRSETLKLVREHFQRGQVRFVDFGSIFNLEQWLARFVGVGRPLLGQALSRSGQAQALEFGLGIDFHLELPFVQAWLDERTKFWAGRVNEETARQLLEELQEANAQGEGLTQVMDRVGDVFDVADEVRKEAIARTEMTASANQGHLSAYRQAGVKRKRWLSELDSRTRTAHRLVHGQVVDLDDDFTVGGEPMSAPGQGSPGNVVNCRCTVTPVVE